MASELDVATLMTQVLILGAIAGLIFSLKKWWLIHVSPNHVIVVHKNERNVLLTGGFHLVKYPFERVAQFEWSYNAEHPDNPNRTIIKRMSGPEIYTQNITMNPAPVVGQTNDGVTVSVNGILTFKISMPVQAVTMMTNLLEFLEICIKNATMETLLCYEHANIKGKSVILAQDIRRKFEGKINEYGVECTEYMIEEITLNDTILKARENAIIKQTEHEKEMAENVRLTQLNFVKNENETRLLNQKHQIELERLTKKRELDAINQDCEKQRIMRQREIEELQEQNQLIVKRAEQAPQQLEQERRLQFVSGLKQQGMNPDTIASILNAPLIAQAAHSGDKWILGKDDYLALMSGRLLPYPPYQIQHDRSFGI
jgi:regulator of protease activity HflC (stomatin/prohibitin superfamily)